MPKTTPKKRVIENNEINTWFEDEVVFSDEMRRITGYLSQSIISVHGYNKFTTNITPTITNNKINVSEGFISFGATDDATYLAKTGTNLVWLVSDAVAGIEIVNPNCFLFVSYNLDYSQDGRLVTITHSYRTSTTNTQAEKDVLIAQITNNAISVLAFLVGPSLINLINSSLPIK